MSPWNAGALGALPYEVIPPLELGPLKFYPFGFLVGVAIVVGTVLAGRRARRVGLDERIVAELALWAVIPGMIGAHLYSAIFYFPEKIAENPLYLLKIWDGISSFGGFLGGAAGVFGYLRWHRIRALPYADVIMYGFLFAWIFGRLGCTVAFDHPGKVTDFALAMPYPHAIEEGPDAGPVGALRHNLGFYELLYTLALCAVVYARRNRPTFAGWHIAFAVVMYAPVRFGFDFLRAVDRTYLGLTAGQYAAIALFALGIACWVRWSRHAEVLVPDGKVHVFPDGTPAIAPQGAAKRSGAKASR